MPIVLSDTNNMAGILINNLIKEEDIARQHSPLDSNIYAEMLRRLNASLFDRVRITWRIQKNCQNNQKITLSCDKTNPTICPVLAALRLVLRAHRLSQPDSMPVACYLKKGIMAHLTGSRIALHFQAAARAVRPNISKDDEQRYSAHSMRVWACVLLDKVGKSPDYILKHLRWMQDSFRMYLRDTHVIQDQHCEALRASSKEVMDLVSALPADILRLSIMSEKTAGEEEDMGVYQDEMD